MSRQPPRLALALLEWFVPNSEPIAGDLMEEFERRQSRAWLWWQALAAVAMASFEQSDEIRPLRLVDHQPADAVERSRNLSLRFRPVNLSVSGVGGLGLVALALFTTRVSPGAWWILFASLLAGIGLGVLMIGMRIRRDTNESRRPSR